MLAAAALFTLAVERGRRSSMQPEAHRQRRMVTEWTAKPHIVLWLVDDQGWANAGWNNQHVYTPRMDTMAKEGVILNRHYSYPWCAPSRAALMTGRMPHDGFENMGQIIPQVQQRE